jgi:hypothetical protein
LFEEGIMKKFMMGMFILLFVVAVSCVGSVKKAEALVIGTDLTFSAAEMDAFTVQSASHAYTINDLGLNLAVNAVTLGATFTDGSFPKSGVAGATGSWMTAPFGSSVDVFLGSTFAAIDITGVDTLRLTAYNDNDDIWGHDVWIEIGGVVTSSAFVDINAGSSAALTLDLTGLDLTNVTGFGVSIHGQLDGGAYPSGGDSFHSSYAPVPEPGTVALLGIGLAGLVGVGARRRAKKKAA